MNFFSINAIEEGGELIHNDKYIHHKLEYELDYWNKYTNELGQIIYILGRPVVDVEKWNDFDNKASFISKILLNEYNSKNIDNFCNDLNGAFSIIIFDKKINKNKISL